MRVWRSISLLVALFCTVFAAGGAMAQQGARPAPPAVPVVDGKRVALIIGNSQYHNPTGWAVLGNAERDARFVAQHLANLPDPQARFEVTLLLNQTHDEMKAALEDYARRAASADISLVYYAGHGFQFKSQNFLAPVDARPSVSERSLDGVHIKFSDVVQAATAKKLTLFFLDACRTTNAITPTSEIDNNVNQATYFGAVETGNSAVIYAAAGGRPAYDAVPADAPTSPFAKAVVDQLQHRGIELVDFYRFVRRDVQQATASLKPGQNPLVAAGLDTRFYFQPQAAGGSAPARPEPGPAPGPLEIPFDELIWEDDEIIVMEVIERYSVDDLRALSQKGDALADYILGIMHFEGIVIEQDWELAEHHFSKSAETLNPAGLYGYAWFVEQLMDDYDAETGEDLAALYQAAHELGFMRATIRLAEAYADSIEELSEEELAEAVQIWQLAAEQDHPRSLFELIRLGDENADQYLRTLNRDMTLVDGAFGEEAATWMCMLDDEHVVVAAQLAGCLRAAQAGEELALHKLTTQLIGREDVDISPIDAQNMARLALQIAELSSDERALVEEIAQGSL